MISFFTLFVEMSSRIAYMALSFVLTFLLSIDHSLELFYLIISPVLIQEIKFLFLDLTEALKATLHLCTIAGSVQTFPYLLYHSWCWSVVGRYPWERKKLALSALSFAISGLPPMVFFYYWALPQMCQFFLDLEISTPAFTIELDSRISTYITLIIQIILFLAIFYYLPWLLISFIKSQLFTSQSLAQYRFRFTWLVALSAAFVSPPRLTLQFALFLLLIVSYEFVVLFGCYYQKILIWRNNRWP